MPRQGMRGRQTDAQAVIGAPDPVVRLLLDLDRRLLVIETGVEEVRQLLVNKPVQKEWYTTGELANAMGVTVFTVTERWCNAGRIDAEKDPESGKWRIPGREYERLVKGGALLPRQK